LKHNYQKYLQPKLDNVNHKSSYLEILHYLLEFDKDNIIDPINYVEIQLHNWEKEYQLPLKKLILKLNEIKYIVEGRQSQLAFRALISKLDTWDGPGEEYAYALYKNKILEWPSKYRYAPWSWITSLNDNEPKRFWDFVKYTDKYPYYFYHESYCSEENNTMIELPALAKKRLKNLSNIIPIKYESEMESNLDDLLLYGGYGSLSGLNWDTKKRFVKIVNDNKCKEIKKLIIEGLPYGAPHKSGEFIIATLIDAGYFERIKTLNITGSYNAINAKAIELLASAHMPYLEELSLSFSLTKSENQQYIKILSQANFPSLKKINLSGSKLNDEGIACLINTSWFSALEEIQLNRNNITDIGIRFLADANINLKNIDLSDNKFSIEGLHDLINSKATANLWSLSIQRNSYEGNERENLDNEQVIQEIASSNLKQLIKLIVWEEYDKEKSQLYTINTAKKIANSPVFKFLDSLLIGYINWSTNCDGFGPEPCPCFTDDVINIFNQSTTLRSSVKNEFILLHKEGVAYQKAAEED